MCANYLANRLNSYIGNIAEQPLKSNLKNSLEKYLKTPLRRVKLT